MSRLYLGAKRRSINFVAHHSHLHQILALPQQVAWTADHLARFRSIFGRLFRDENFVTLLRAESLAMIPEHLASLFDADGGERK